LTWKPAEDGDGTILRLQESAGKAYDVTINSKFLSFERSWLCNALEDNQSELKRDTDTLTLPINPFQVLTIRVRTQPRIERENGISR